MNVMRAKWKTNEPGFFRTWHQYLPNQQIWQFCDALVEQPGGGALLRPPTCQLSRNSVEMNSMFMDKMSSRGQVVDGKLVILENHASRDEIFGLK